MLAVEVAELSAQVSNLQAEVSNATSIRNQQQAQKIEKSIPYSRGDQQK